MVVGCGMICAMWGFHHADIRLSGGRTFLNPMNCRSLLFARSAAERSGFVQEMMWRAVSLNPRTWVVGIQVVAWIVDSSLFVPIQKKWKLLTFWNERNPAASCKKVRVYACLQPIQHQQPFEIRGALERWRTLVSRNG